MNYAVSCGSAHQSCDSEQIVGGADQIGIHLHPFAPAIAGLAQTADRLHPTKRLLDSLSYSLAYRVARMTSGPCIERGPSWARVILCDVWGDVERTTGC